MPIRWTDDHCHLGWDVDEEVDAEVDAMVAEARAAGVERLITVGTDALRSAEAVRAAARHPGVVWATVGLHPHEARHGLDGIVDLLAETGRDRPRHDLRSHGRSGRGSGEHVVVAVGECGLDYHYDHSPRPVQRDMFAAQIALAHERDLALVIHTREAWDDTFAVLDVEGVPARTVFHCFTGGPDEARACLDRDGYLSFSGIVTFGSASDVRAAAAFCPLERLLVETDSPYLAPVPYRGRPNRPALVPLVGAAVADVMGVAVDAVAEATWANAERVYRLP
jgi:TatD DNase family protein